MRPHGGRCRGIARGICDDSPFLSSMLERRGKNSKSAGVAMVGISIIRVGESAGQHCAGATEDKGHCVCAFKVTEDTDRHRPARGSSRREDARRPTAHAIEWRHTGTHHDCNVVWATNMSG